MGSDGGRVAGHYFMCAGRLIRNQTTTQRQSRREALVRGEREYTDKAVVLVWLHGSSSVWRIGGAAGRRNYEVLKRARFQTMTTQSYTLARASPKAAGLGFGFRFRALLRRVETFFVRCISFHPAQVSQAIRKSNPTTGSEGKGTEEHSLTHERGEGDF
jgi:hypothetical protein